MTEADVINNTAGFVVWLADDHGQWHARTVTFSLVAIAGKSLATLRAMVRDEHAKHHDFNALILGAGVVSFLPNDDHFRLGIDTLLRHEVAHLPVPPDFSGPPPWHFGEFTIVGIGPVGIGNALHLVVNHQVDPWVSRVRLGLRELGRSGLRAGHESGIRHRRPPVAIGPSYILIRIFDLLWARTNAKL